MFMVKSHNDCLTSVHSIVYVCQEAEQKTNEFFQIGQKSARVIENCKTTTTDNSEKLRFGKNRTNFQLWKEKIENWGISELY